MPLRNKWVKRAVFFAAMLAAVEVSAFLVLWISGVVPEKSYLEMYRTSSCLKANPYNDGGQTRSTEQAEISLSKLPHPFFGFVTNTNLGAGEPANHLLHQDYENELRYRIVLDEDPRAPNTFTIGIFGASVAGAFADHVIADDTFRRQLQKNIPYLSDKHVVIRNMAIGSSRQPAQFAIATQYMELLDMTINLDGYSEMNVIQFPRFPIEYPMFADAFYTTDGPSPYLYARTTEEICYRISTIPDDFRPLAFSSLYYLTWYNLSQRLHAALTPPRIAESDAAWAKQFPRDEQRLLYARYYKKYSRYQHQILSANAVRPYFFLQPNQYVEDSKTFSADEREDALGYGDASEVTARYRLLQEMIAELQKDGIAAYDLTAIYESVRETIYIDSCCHVNERGNRIIAENIAAAIIRRETAIGIDHAPPMNAAANH